MSSKSIGDSTANGKSVDLPVSEKELLSRFEGILGKSQRDIKKTTKNIRRQSDRSIGKLKDASNLATNIQETLAKTINKTEDKSDYANAAASALVKQIGIFISASKNENSVNTGAIKLRKWARELGLVGILDDEKYKEFLNKLSSTSLKSSIRKREEGPRLFINEKFLSKNPSISQNELENKAIELVSNHLTDFITEINSQFILEEQLIAREIPTDPEVFKSILDEISQEFLGLQYESISGKARRANTDFTVVFIYSKVDKGVLNSRYAIFTIKVNFRDVEEVKIGLKDFYNKPIPKVEISIEDKKYDTGIGGAIISSVETKQFSPIINELIARTIKDAPILEFGHIVSLTQRQMAKVVNTIDTVLDIELGNLSNILKSTIAYKNLQILRANLRIIYTVTKKVDTIFQDITQGDSLLTGRDIIEFLQNNNIDSYVTFVQKSQSKVSPTGAVFNVKEAFDINATIETTPTGNPEGILEVIPVNRVKGAIVKYLKNMFAKELASDIAGNIIPISEQMVLKQLLESRSDSVVDSLVKNAFPGTKIKRRKLKYTKKSRTKTISSRPTKNTKLKKVESKTVPTNIEVGSGVKTKISSKNIVIRGKTTKGSKPVEANINLLAAVNSEIGEEVRSLMKYPRLVNRTGRFASSVKILTLTGKEVTFTYKKDPYEIFSRETGRPPWNSVLTRDPYDTISKAITKILSKYDKLQTPKVIREV